jgi:hypothetical protein
VSDTQPRGQVQPCGCVVTETFGHTHTKGCEQHKREWFAPHGQTPPDNRDLIGD